VFGSFSVGNVILKQNLHAALKRHKKTLSHVQRKFDEEIELFYKFNCEYKLKGKKKSKEDV
jgi:hypothetical protein